MVERVTYIFNYIAKSSDYDEQENEVYEIISKNTNKIFATEEAPESDYHWKICIINNGSQQYRIILSYSLYSKLREKSTGELQDELSEAKEELEELEEEYEEIEDLDENDYYDYGFDSETEYKEKLEELNADIYIVEANIEMIEKILEEKSISK